ncbi:YceD family protein [Vogesella fluminis]|uniref:YceD family protein n=1 Tax=Vogesella fluminis TaxID=1069161 RepID=UPI003625B1E4
MITLFSREDKLEAAVEADDELDAILAEETFDVIALIEDEIIMGLPLSLMHDDCDTEELKRAKADKPNPFAVLAVLKQSRS